MSSDPQKFGRVMELVRSAARQLMKADGVTFVVRDGNECAYLEEDAVGPLWKGQRFPLEKCVSGWVMTHGTSAVIPDIYRDPRVLLDAYRPTFVKSMAMIPIGTPPVAAIGVYWQTPHVASDSQLEMLAALADSALLQVNEQD